MLVSHHFFLLFEVSDNLCQAFLKDLDLILVRLNFVDLHLSSLLVLLLSARIDRNVTLDLPVGLLL